MRAINHSLTGAFIGLTVVQPEIALPLAFVSHFVLDAIPHHGYENAGTGNRFKDSHFIAMLIIDAILCGLLVLVLILTKPSHWPLAAACAFLAALPDFFSFNRFYKAIKGRPWQGNLYSRFASKIQWFEKPSGAIVEIVWLVGLIFCLSLFIRH